MDLHELKFFSMGSALQEDSCSLVLNMRYCCILCNWYILKMHVYCIFCETLYMMVRIMLSYQPSFSILKPGTAIKTHLDFVKTHLNASE